MFLKRGHMSRADAKVVKSIFDFVLFRLTNWIVMRKLLIVFEYSKQKMPNFLFSEKLELVDYSINYNQISNFYITLLLTGWNIYLFIKIDVVDFFFKKLYPI